MGVCFAPVRGFRGFGGSLTSRRHSPTQAPIVVPCGRCLGCRMDRARDWGTRIAHEATLHAESSFLTLTYRDEALPDDFSVSLRELQLFIKRLRKRLEPLKVRFFACGEYGDKGQRPHYHVILFGYSFPDKVLWRTTQAGFPVYRSALLEAIWTSGHSEVGSVTRESGAYVARYCLKKISGDVASDYYMRLHPVNGTISTVRPEFAVMSTKPGIGYGWFKRFESDAFPSGFVIMQGRKVPVPRYYKNKLRGRYDFKSSDPEALVDADDLRGPRVKGKANSRLHAADNTDERLAVREELAQIKQAAFKRDLDED